MSDENYQTALTSVLKHEGGYSNDKDDPGGATMWGITHIDYDAYRRLKRLPTQDVRRMTTQERDEIYKKKYWTGARCDDLPSGVDYVTFDGAVNSGVAQSAKWLQRALGVSADGHIGDQTLLAASHANPETVIHSMCDQRRKFLRQLRTFKTFGRGWMRRVDEVEAAALALVNNEEEPNYYSDAGAKASTKDISQPMISQEAATGTTVASGGAAGLISQLQAQIAPFSDALTYAKYALFVIAIIGVGVTIYASWKSSKARSLA